MATDLSPTSRFSLLVAEWGSRGHVERIGLRTITDQTHTTVELSQLRDYENVADDSNLALLRENYADNDGFLDTDGNTITVNVRNFTLAGGDVPVEDLSKYGSFNPFVAAEADGYFAALQSRGAFVREGDYSEDDDTGRPRLTDPFDHIPAHRNPGGTTFAFPLTDWVAAHVFNDIRFTRDYTADEAVTDPNTEDSVVAFLAWIDTLRITGDAVGDDILAVIDTFADRTYRLDQGNGDTLDLEISSGGHNDEDSIYSHVSISFRRVSGETDDIDIEAIRELLLETTGDIPVEGEPEVPVIGSTDVDQRARGIVLPDNYRLGIRGSRLTLEHPSMGVFPLDGAHVRATRFDDLDDLTGVTNGKWMPNDGSAVIHFGHAETAHSILRYRSLGDMLPSEGADLVQRVHNVSSLYDVTLQDPNGLTLLRLLPFEQSGPMQVALEVGGNAGEILAIDPPDRRVVLSRGVALPNFSGGTSYESDNGDYHTLRMPSSTIKHLDTDGWTAGTAADPVADAIDDVTPADWDILGSFALERTGWVNIVLFYRLAIVDPAPSGEFARGNGPSLWISPGGNPDLVRDHFSGAEALGGVGGTQDYAINYYGKHNRGTRFLFLHRIPSLSDIDEDDYDHIDMEALVGDLILTPEIRMTVT